MIRTPLCDLLAIDVPIICAPFGPFEQVELAAAVSNAGGLGSLGTAVRPVEDLEAQWERMRTLTDRPFAINHTVRPFSEEAFEATLRFGPAAISFHLGVPPDLIARAHDAGIPWIQQVMNCQQGEEALTAGADVIIAQGGEAGGNGGWVATMVLVPQLVDLAGDIPVVAAGGIADGRGLAAALALGAQGVSMGTRFLASTEMRVSDDWKRRIVDADAVDAVKVVNSERVMPPFNRPGGPAEPRALATPLIEQLRSNPEWIDPAVMGARLRDDPDSVDPAQLGPELVQALLDGRGHEYLPFTGQSAALVHDIPSAREVIERTIAEAEAALARV